MDIKDREKIEWLNYWIEDADKDKKRIILLGDSVAREIRKKLNSMINESYAVDLLAMSYSVLDDITLEEIRHFFLRTPYKYDMIIYQLGAHHGYGVECMKSDEDAENFKIKTEEILKSLKQYSIPVITMSPTLERCVDRNGNKIFNHNEEIRKRNQILAMVSEKLNIIYFDLNEKIDYKEIRYVDWCHFEEDCYEYISRLIISRIFPDIQCADSNRLKSMRELNNKFNEYKEKKIYIYGNGIRGKYIKEYLQRYEYPFNGFIVSNEYADMADDTKRIDQIEKNDALIIVTPVDANIWTKLEKEKIDYISLNSDIYMILRTGSDML